MDKLQNRLHRAFTVLSVAALLVSIALIVMSAVLDSGIWRIVEPAQGRIVSQSHNRSFVVVSTPRLLPIFSLLEKESYPGGPKIEMYIDGTSVQAGQPKYELVRIWGGNKSHLKHWDYHTVALNSLPDQTISTSAQRIHFIIPVIVEPEVSTFSWYILVFCLFVLWPFKLRSIPVLLIALIRYAWIALSKLPMMPLYNQNTAEYLNLTPMRTGGYHLVLQLLLGAFHNPFSITITQTVVLIAAIITLCASIEFVFNAPILATLLGVLLFLKDGSLMWGVWVGPDSLFESCIMFMIAGVILAIKNFTPVRLCIIFAFFSLALFLRPAAVGLLPGLLVFLLIEFRHQKRYQIGIIMATAICFLFVSCANFIQTGYWTTQKLLGSSLIGTVAFMLDQNTKTNYPELSKQIIQSVAPYKQRIYSAASLAERRKLFDNFCLDGIFKAGIPLAREYILKHSTSNLSEKEIWSKADDLLVSISISTFLAHPKEYAFLSLQRVIDNVSDFGTGIWLINIASIYPAYFQHPQEPAQIQWMKECHYKNPDPLYTSIIDPLKLKYWIEANRLAINWVFCSLDLLAIVIWFINLKLQRKLFLNPWFSLAAAASLCWFSYIFMLALTGSCTQVRYLEVAAPLFILGAISMLAGTLHNFIALTKYSSSRMLV